jgi:hypothetical protein
MASFNYRYPNARIEETSDFLEVKVVEYKPPGTETSAEQPMKLSTSTQSLQKNIETPLGYIFLPIPEDIKDSNSVDWGDKSLNGLAAAGLGMGIKAMNETNPLKAIGGLAEDAGSKMQAMAKDPATKDLANSFFASKAVNILGGNTSLSGVLARTSGQVMNPNMELLFKGVQLRAFDFIFDLAPRDKKESETIKNIIRTFKVNMNAKNSSGSDGSETSGLFIKSPNVFQLGYKTGGESHKFLHKFKPMALKNMIVNYTGSGTYATYEDTTPIHMQLTLSFQELNPIYAEDYENEEGKIGVGY